MTTVAKVAGRSYREIAADVNSIYVGRRVLRRGFPGSQFGNPFRADMDLSEVTRVIGGLAPRVLVQLSTDARGSHVFDVDCAVRTYESWFLAQPGLCKKLPELRGKTLVCWCVDWDGVGEPRVPCHAVVLARLAEVFRAG